MIHLLPTNNMLKHQAFWFGVFVCSLEILRDVKFRDVKGRNV